jgi:uncharacterized membrane protein
MWSHLRGSERFKEEIDWWQKQGWVSPEQANLLIDSYGLNLAPPWYRQSGVLIKAISLFIVAMGIFLLISANWQELPMPVQMIAGLLPLAVAYFVGGRAYLRGDVASARLAMIFASLIFGANIALQAQIFHISAYYPDGILWWIIGALPVIFFFQSTFLAVIFQGLFLMWLFWQNEYFQFSLWSPALMLAFGYFVYKKPHWLDLLFILGSFYMFLVNVIIFVEEKRLERVYEIELMPLFFSAYILLFMSIFTFVKKDYAGKFAANFQTALQTIIVFFFYIFTFHEAVASVAEGIVSKGVPTSFYALLLIACVLHWQGKEISREAIDKPARTKLTIAFAIVGLLFIPALFLSFVKVEMSQLKVYVDFIFMGMNVLFFAYCIWKIYHGISTREKGDFMRGIFYLMIWLIGRYIILFEDYLTTSIIFILAGAGLYYLNNYWNKKFEG